MRFCGRSKVGDGPFEYHVEMLEEEWLFLKELLRQTEWTEANLSLTEPSKAQEHRARAMMCRQLAFGMGHREDHQDEEGL